MTSAYYSTTASADAKKQFALKVMTAAKNGGAGKITFQYNNKTYNCDTLMDEIRKKGYTEDLAFVASNIIYQVKLS